MNVVTVVAIDNTSFVLGKLWGKLHDPFLQFGHWRVVGLF